MPTPETRSISCRIEDAVKASFPSTTINSKTIAMHVIDDNSREKEDLYAVVECRELTQIHPVLKDYSAVIELTAISQIAEDKTGGYCDALLKVLMAMFSGTISKSNLSSASSLAVDAVLPADTGGASDDVFNIKTCTAKIYIQNAT